MGKEEDEKKAICRDFLRNICSRGDSCKYAHPTKKFVFCHDYQNGKCKRGDCMFIHCSRDDEEHYNQYGELPPHLAELPQICQMTDRDQPVCKDFLKGDCTRIVCKFRHIEYSTVTYRGGRHCDIDDRECEPYFKRQRFDSEPKGYYGQFEAHRERSMWTLEDENAMLRKTVEELKKRVDDLLATNEFLLEQNAQMRMGEKASARLTSLTVPTVTITNAPQVSATIGTVSAPCVATVPVSLAAVAATPVSLAAVSMAQAAVQIATPSVTMAQQHNQDSTTTLQAASLVSYPLVARPVLASNLPR